MVSVGRGRVTKKLRLESRELAVHDDRLHVQTGSRDRPHLPDLGARMDSPERTAPHSPHNPG